ncbi:MAG TPA: extradiol ring-cleavage dioxygenase [Xanthobacteraceae bacterium]|nr:extradiol ring-cleavage dioxygenase [Xanthobacteraceae bacterium]
MADIVLAIGTSHSPLLASPPEDYPKHAEIDAKGRKLLDRNGQPATYGDLLAAADPTIADQISLEVMSERAARCNADIDHVAAAIREAKLDALIIIGDDQHEQFFDDNMPAILIYSGDTIENRTLDMPEDAPEFWRKARGQYHEPAAAREYPVAAPLARHLTTALVNAEFDISHSKRFSAKHGEGHAFGFVHRRLMGEDIVPIVPVALNTYFPPNQPTPKRCYALGEAIRDAVRSWSEPARVGILASGGLSHFTVDEELDRLILDACRNHDKAALLGIPANKLNSGTSEVRNWITTAAAASHLTCDWQDYVPCYRSLAGTGCGMGFAIWR